MNKIAFEKSGRAISSTELNEFQDFIGKELPKEWISFYSDWNGGVPVQYIYWKEDDVYVINHFLPIKYEMQGALAIEEVYLDLGNEGVIDKEYLPFILEESGGYFMISLSSCNYGKIYYWDHECSCGEPFVNSIKYISENLQDFLSYLTEEHPD